MDEAVRTRLLERFRKDLDDSRLRGVAKSQYEQELEVLIEALSTGCGAGQHDYAVREGHPPLYCRRCGVGKVPRPERPGVVDGADAAQTIYRQAQKIEDLRHKVQSQELAISEQRATIEALHEAEGRLVRQREELRQQVEALQGRIDSQVMMGAISESERERYVKQIGQLVGERDRLKEQVGTLEARVRDPDPELKRRIEELEQKLGRMQVARDMASEQLASLRRSIRGFARQHAP